ncbi:ATP-binding protein [Streptomyces sp. TS71-3]|uniref:ATP-binding protein n=1 Tax=Streptomyces sp. TS71-3 TaxID=2733862 RepID=UPI001B281CEF|nr:ATP-binding protein [Streptomyces sp. TS71-3]GHJ38686.1 hypothetical protein Sm713_42950 [Streptomyces sp. TS71-3]
MAPPALDLPSASTPCDGTRHRAVVLRLPAVAASVARARAGARRLLRERRLSPEVAEDAVLVISELVTNAIAHTTGSQVVCRLRAGRTGLRIEVQDQGGGAATPHPRSPAHEDERGRGLVLVGALSSTWGVRQNPGGPGRTVWAELPLTSARPPAAAPAPARPAPLPRLVPSPPGRPRAMEYSERFTFPDGDRP